MNNLICIIPFAILFLLAAIVAVVGAIPVKKVEHKAHKKNKKKSQPGNEVIVTGDDGELYRAFIVERIEPEKKPEKKHKSWVGY